MVGKSFTVLKRVMTALVCSVLCVVLISACSSPRAPISVLTGSSSNISSSLVSEEASSRAVASSKVSSSVTSSSKAASVSSAALSSSATSSKAPATVPKTTAKGKAITLSSTDIATLKKILAYTVPGEYGHRDLHIIVESTVMLIGTFKLADSVSSPDLPPAVKTSYPESIVKKFAQQLFATQIMDGKSYKGSGIVDFKNGLYFIEPTDMYTETTLKAMKGYDIGNGYYKLVCHFEIQDITDMSTAEFDKTSIVRKSAASPIGWQLLASVSQYIVKAGVKPYVNIRSEPNTSAGVVGKLYPGDAVTVSGVISGNGSKSGWGEIDTGWVSMDLLTPDSAIQ